MRTLALIALVVAAVPAEAQVVTEMTPELIREAIAAGGEPYVLRDGAVFVGGLSTPYSRVARAAREAKTAYKPFAEGDVTPEMLKPQVEIAALRQWTRHGSRWKRVVAIVVAPIKSKDPGLAIQPSDGTSIDNGGMVARFPLSVLSEGNEVRIVYDGAVCGRSPECVAGIKLEKIR